MTRMIKFRGWDTNRKKMYSADEMGRDQLTLSVDGRGFVNVSGDDTSKSMFCTHILPLQFTGMKDQNGVEIFEDDLIMATFEQLFGNYIQAIGVMEWSDDDGCWGIDFPQHGTTIGRFSAHNLSVLGNVHEHPEKIPT